MSHEPMRIESGLRAIDGAPIPLRGVDVEGEVLGGTSRVKVKQRYQNVESKPLEAIYTFPLPSDATLVGFTMECRGRRIEGVVKERDEAFRTYDEAMVSGHGAALLDQERPNVFTASVGNLLPGETTLVEVEYVQRLHADEGALRIMIPTLVAPRYVPGNAAGDRTGHGAADPTDRVSDADRISPRIGATDYSVGLDLVLHLGTQIDVRSPSHALVVERHDGKTRVRFAEGRVPLDRDVVLLVEGANESKITTCAAHRDGEVGAFVFSHVVDLFEPKRKARALDVVFVLDRSGSMGGSSIEEARKALRLCLRQLREGDRFSIVAFDDREETFRPEPVPFTQKTLEQADRWIASIDARGGTELLAPLLRAVDHAKDGVVVLLTDGQVGNEDEILSAVLGKRASTRIYTFGIGTNVSDTLLRELARRTGGAVESIHPGERIDEKVVATFSRAIASRVRDVKVRFHDVEVDDLAPSSFPDLVDGEPWTVLGRYRTPGLGKVEVRGTLDGEPWVLEVPIELPAKADAPTIQKLWAAERIRDLEATELAMLSGGADGRRARAMKDRIVALATEHGIASRYTSFVVVERRDDERRAQEPAEARPIPVNAPAGWTMTQRPRFEAMMVGGAPGAMPFGMPKPAPPPAFAPAPMAMPMRARAGSFAATGAPPPPSAAAPKKKSGLLARAARSVQGLFDRGAEGGAPKGASVRSDEGEALEEALELSAPAPHEEADEEASERDPVFAILSRQLASGLWPAKDDVAQLEATTRALVTLLAGGIDAGHPLHGELVRKAVEALVPLAERLAASAPAQAERALGVAWLASVGRRTRRTVRDAIANAKLDALLPRLDDEPALRASLLSA